MSLQDQPHNKYAALILPRVGGPPEHREVVSGKETFIAGLSLLIASAELDHWREWLGSLAWEQIDANPRIVIIRASTEHPAVLDNENDRLVARVSNSWRAFLLCEADPRFDERAYVVTGAAVSGDYGSKLATVRSTSTLNRIAPLWFATRETFIKKVLVPRYTREWEMTGTHREKWFPRWLEIDRLLSSVRWSPLLAYALLAHENARTSVEPEFAIPGLVRAAEGVLALPAGSEGGAANFARRALRLVPGLAEDPYVGEDIESLLVELYRARNECVHGKVPFRALQEQGEAGIERVAEMSYVADALAREALLAAFRFQDRAVFEKREALEEAWKTGAFPS
jgi:hypothetical protein